MKLKAKPAYLSIIILLLLWQVLAMWVNHYALFPSLTLLIKELGLMLMSAEFYSSLGLTILRGLIGFTIALSLSALLASIAFQQSFWKSFLQPLIVVSRSVPVISIVLIALLLMSPKGLPIFIAFFTMFPILYQNILNGLEHTDQKLVQMAKSFNKSNFQRFRYIYFPSARKYIFAGIGTAMGFGWRSVIIGEVLAVPVHGIGSAMKNAQAFIEMKELLAWTVVAILVSFAFDYVVKLIAQKEKSYQLSAIKSKTTNNTKSADLKELITSNLNLSFKERSLFNDFNLSIKNDKIHLLNTPSGTGKTTLLNLIAGIAKADAGSIDTTPINMNIAYAFQDLRLMPWMNIEANIGFALANFPHIHQAEKEKLNRLLTILKLEKHSNKYPHELSGGEQQRVNLARALIAESDILLLDEPLNGLDQALKSVCIELIETEIKQNKPLVIWASHEDIENHTQLAFQKINISS